MTDTPNETEKAAARQKAAARPRTWRAAHIDEVKARDKAYRAAHADEVKAHDRAYRAANADKISAQKAAYYLANRERILATKAARRGREEVAPMTPRRHRRDKVFGPGPRVPLDREAKVRVMAYAKAWNARHRLPGQHRGPLTRATGEVLEALLWGFHNADSGACFPSYEAIAAKAECCRDTVCEAIKALAFAGVLTWVNRIVRERVRERDLFGQWVDPVAGAADLQRLCVPGPESGHREPSGF